ncbi:hypothetical protein A5788_21370 [Gordonia sp. 852002-50816_SCH5313054-c]|nr:hypothetical protein A5785_15695 [Gordonia sp. 852002-50395_SCH5434458]OBC12355.1 hypothetical protein A5788_21370 [Gordonia sp. 852002-50816_SCH5313054-c]OBC20772.1 hypothetical protein A5786_15775 [Gordonia sp. 852002-50816_SCH5313054-a]
MLVGSVGDLDKLDQRGFGSIGDLDKLDQRSGARSARGGSISEGALDRRVVISTGSISGVGSISGWVGRARSAARHSRSAACP